MHVITMKKEAMYKKDEEEYMVGFDGRNITGSQLKEKN